MSCWCRASRSRGSRTSRKMRARSSRRSRRRSKRPTRRDAAPGLERDIADREVTIMGDKVVPYSVLKKVMATCTDADSAASPSRCCRRTSRLRSRRARNGGGNQQCSDPTTANSSFPGASTTRIGSASRRSCVGDGPRAAAHDRDSAAADAGAQGQPPRNRCRQRLAKLMLEKREPPPPPPPPKEEPKPEVKKEPKPEPKPVDRQQEARKKAAVAGLLPFKDELADLRDNRMVGHRHRESPAHRCRACRRHGAALADHLESGPGERGHQYGDS